MKFDEYGFHYPADIASIAFIADSVTGLSRSINGKTWGYNLIVLAYVLARFNSYRALLAR